MSLCVADGNFQGLYAVLCCITNVINENIFVWLFVYFGIILVLFCLRLLILIVPSKKIVLTIFDINFSYTIYPCTSIISYFLDFGIYKIIWLIIISAWNPTFSKNVQRFLIWFYLIQFVNNHRLWCTVWSSLLVKHFLVFLWKNHCSTYLQSLY